MLIGSRKSALCFCALLAACGDDLEPEQSPPEDNRSIMMPENMSNAAAMETLVPDAGSSSDNMSIAEPMDGLEVETLQAHNAVRRQLNAGLPDLEWSEELALVAQEWAENLVVDCGSQLYHRMPNDFGENIAQRNSIGFNVTMTVEEAVDGWAAEVDCWTYGEFQTGDSCDSACIAAQNSTGCGHYTQLVWDRAETVGCGYASCDTTDGWLSEVWVCNYDPPGNVIGQTPY